VTEEHYYGLGQAGPGLDKDGTTRRLWNSHYGYGPGTDMAVPLVISSRGYGLFFDNSWDAEVAFRRTEQTSTLLYTGDIANTFDVFDAQLPLGLSTALSGVPYWGTDIGGFFHTVPESAELFVRWFQFAAFCPVFRSHGRGIGPRGWREHLPWAHGEHIEAICRDYAVPRYRLFRYNYSLAWRAHTHGTPLMRPLVLEFPSDANVVDMSAEFMWARHCSSRR
jgi:alpha-glucosidase (family GH31 glycosyl hydrolase)